MDKVFIRPLNLMDADISWKWRNDPEIWKHTGNKPSLHITPEMERVWLSGVLCRDDERRFAICEVSTGKYIGNVQLTGINGYDAALHIFIGDKASWGKGFGTEATRLVVNIGLKEIGLQSIYLDVKKENRAAIAVYDKTGFKLIFEWDSFSRMAIYATDEFAKKISVFVMTYNHEKYIREALEGILMQDVNCNYEIIVGDDFSTDLTRKILMDYAIKNPGKFKLLFYPKNISANENQVWVLKNCSAEYIAMCEGDDFWTDPNKLKKQVDFLDKAVAFSGAFHETKVVDEINAEGTEKINKVYGGDSVEIVTAEETLSQWALFHTSSFLFRKSSLVIPHWFKTVVSADMALFSIIAASGPLIKIPGVMSAYRKHADGLTHTAAVSDNLDRNRISLIRFLDEFHKYKYSAKAKAIIGAHEASISRRLKSENTTGIFRWITNKLSFKTGEK